ncbi:MAG: ABC transporter ATP-binding protein [Clostridiales bacterium]|nr:ABC transporter ATP-binding protein [Clostridiales bacterium]
MSEFVKGLKKHEGNDIQYQGNAFLRMMGYVKPYWKTVVVCCLLVAALTALELYKPELIGNAIDRYITQETAAGELTPDERFNGVLVTAGLYLLVMLASFVCNRAQYLMIQEMGQKIVYNLRMQVMTHVQSLSMRFFDTTPVGRIVTRITNDTESINDLYSNIIVRLFRNVVKVVALIAWMLVLDVKMALYSLIMVPVVAGLTFVFRKLSRKCYQIVRTRITALNTFLSEHLSGMRIIQIFHREEEKCEEFGEKNQQLYRAGFREMMIFGIFRPLIYFASISATAIILGGGSAQVLAGVITIGTLYKFTQYINQLFQPIQELAEMFTTLQSAIASAEKIFTLLDTKSDVNEQENPVKLPAVRGRIEFDHVWFAYETVDGETPTAENAGKENWVLRDVSFTIEPGQKVAFVGATGAGKSSILNLIGRYYDIQKGAIRIDGVDIREMSREQIRSAIGQVQQDVFVFTGDIARNIRLRDESITDAAIREAAHNTNASHFIERLPGGYHERVTERGATFSSGQRQLLSFARTLAYDPTILILDEATANIDTETEQWIQEAVQHLMEGRTSIMVAHRLSTIQHCDRIIVMHHGKIRESGTHQELLEQNGIYKKLYQLQLA